MSPTRPVLREATRARVVLTACLILLAAPRGSAGAPPPRDLPVPIEPVSLENRAGRLGAAHRGDHAGYLATLSGTLIRQTQPATTTWYLYPNACNERYAGTWAPRTAITADSLNTYSTTVENHGYQLEDQSLRERLWHVSDGTATYEANGLAPIGTPIPLDGTRSLWCGKTNPIWIVPSGYPNSTYQILYVDTGAHSSAYTLSWIQNASTESNYDFFYVIGGNGGTDPIGNSRAIFDHIIDSGSDAAGDLLIAFTGSIQLPQAFTAVPPPGLTVNGVAAGQPITVSVSLAGIPATHRGLYFVLRSNELFSPEDGSWPEGHGIILDELATSDNGLIYDDQSPAGGTDAFDGDVIVGTPSAPVVSARVPPGVGTLWQIVSGNTIPTADACALQKQFPADHFFHGADPSTHLTVANSFASIRTCTFPIPPGTASVLATWSAYMNLPLGSGFVAYAEYRVFRASTWQAWKNTAAGGSVRVGALQRWIDDGDELAEAPQADSVQLRFNLACIPALSADGVNCTPSTYGVLYDNLRLQLVTGVPPPVFGILPAAVAQTTFVDGTFGYSVNCLPATIAAGQCWPGVRGSDVDVITGTPASISGPVRDNFNSPLGDSITLALVSGVRTNGMGINWRFGFDKSVNAGRTVAHVNGAFQPAYDTPRVIFRLFDPATRTWSPFDSSELDADAVAAGPAETTVVDSRYRMNWPPRDKYYVNSGAGDPAPNVDEYLPGFPIWSLNGRARYSQVKFLPRGTRLQYYFKAVDINGGAAYQFSSDNLAYEGGDLPELPGSSIPAPDILEFDVLPGVYPPGSYGSLLAGKANTPLLVVEGAYTAWGFPYDPLNRAIRGMGVRADRYRMLQGEGLGNGVGGHELPGERPGRLGNYFPNLNEYAILDSLDVWYAIVQAFSQFRTGGIFAESDGLLWRQWWLRDAAFNAGDRGFFGYGDDFGYNLLHPPAGAPAPERAALANALGVYDAAKAWSGAAPRQRLFVDDLWTAPSAGPYWSAPGSFRFEVGTICRFPSNAGWLTKMGGSQSHASEQPAPPIDYELMGIRTSQPRGPFYGYSRRVGGITEKAVGFKIPFLSSFGFDFNVGFEAGFTTEPTMREVQKDQTVPKAAKKLGDPPDTTTCFPCPSDPNLTGNWATLPGFQQSVYGPLYAIQDPLTATGISTLEAPRLQTSGLDGNAPNPFNPSTRIRFRSAVAGHLTVHLFSVAGRIVRSLSATLAGPGPGEVRWDGRAEDGSPLPSGVYFYRVRFPDGSRATNRMVMLK